MGALNRSRQPQIVTPRTQVRVPPKWTEGHLDYKLLWYVGLGFLALARLVRRHPWYTLWTLMTLGAYGAHTYVLVALVLVLPLVAIGLWKKGVLHKIPAVGHVLGQRRIATASARPRSHDRAGKFIDEVHQIIPRVETPVTKEPIFPTVVGVGDHQFGWWIELDLPHGITPADFRGAKQEQMAHMMRVFRMAVESPSPGRVVLRFFTRDPLLDDELANVDIASLPPFEVGVYDDGSSMTWDYVGSPHMIVVGQTRSGKSAFLRTLLLSLPSDGSWVVSLADHKVVEFGLYKPGGKVSDSVTSVKDIADLCERFEAEMRQRLDDMHRAGVSRADDLPNPPPRRLILIDEYMAFCSAADNAGRPRRPAKGEEPEEGVATMVRRAQSAIGQLAVQGGAAGFHVVLGLQSPAAEIFGSAGKRGQFRAVVALRALDRTSAGMAFQGATADGEDLMNLFNGRAGCGVCINVGGDLAGIQPRRFRAHFAKDEVAARKLICGS